MSACVVDLGLRPLCFAGRGNYGGLQSSANAKRIPKGLIQKKTCGLDSYVEGLAFKNISLIKLDCEGCEGKVRGCNVLCAVCDALE